MPWHSDFGGKPVEDRRGSISAPSHTIRWGTPMPSDVVPMWSRAVLESCWWTQESMEM
jgi:hypothetical protein